jgi:predicted RNA-binding protein
MVDSNDYVKSFTYGVYCSRIPEAGCRIESWDILEGDYENFKLKYINGSLITTAEPKSKVSEEKVRLLELLDDNEVKTKIKNIKTIQ